MRFKKKKKFCSDYTIKPYFSFFKRQQPSNKKKKERNIVWKYIECVGKETN